MTQIQLPIAPFETHVPYTRGGEQFVTVYGINDQGFAFLQDREVAPDPETELEARWVPQMEPPFDDYGVSQPIRYKWVRKLYNNGRYVQTVNEQEMEGITNHPDMIGFTAVLGLKMIFPLANGLNRNLRGYDDMPVFDELGRPIPDSVYGDKIYEAPVRTYYEHFPEVVPEPQPVAEEPSDE